MTIAEYRSQCGRPEGRFGEYALRSADWNRIASWARDNNVRVAGVNPVDLESDSQLQDTLFGPDRNRCNALFLNPDDTVTIWCDQGVINQEYFAAVLSDTWKAHPQGGKSILLHSAVFGRPKQGPPPPELDF